MNIIFIDPFPPLLEQIYQLAEKHDDNIYTISPHDIDESKNHLKLEFMSDYKIVIEELSRNGIDPDCIFTMSDTYARHIEKLNQHYNLKSIQNNISKFRDKFKMKELYNKHNIAHAKGKIIKNTEELKDNTEISYPIIIKPSSGYASAGVAKVESLDELINEYKNISLLNNFSFSRNYLNEPQIIIEEFIEGIEYACDSLWKNGERIYTVIHRHYSGNGPYFPDSLYVMNPLLNKNIRNLLIEAEKNVHHSLGTSIGFTHTEYKLSNNIPFIIETTNRPGAGGLYFEHIKKATGVDFLSIFYNSIIHNNKIDITEEIDTNYFYYSNTVQFKENGKIDKISGLEMLKDNPDIISVYDFSKERPNLLPINMRTNYTLIYTGKIDIQNTPDKYIEKLDSELKLDLIN